MSCLVCWKKAHYIEPSKADGALDQALDRIQELEHEQQEAAAREQKQRTRIRKLTERFRESTAQLSEATAVLEHALRSPIPPQRLRTLIMLCHPDRHNNSERATEMTRWLLALRDK